MSNTVTHSPGLISVVPDGTTDFDSTTLFPNGLRVKAVHFQGSVGADYIKVRNRLITGAFIIPNMVSEEKVDLDCLDCFPYIKAAECQFTTAASCLITFYVE